MSSRGILRAFTAVYLLVFFAYLFLPLVIMVAAAFNKASIPSVTPWRGTTLAWFENLFHDRLLWKAVLNSLIIGAGVVALAVPVGLAGALMLARLQGRARGFLYAVMVSPILTPGVILGISTLIFWKSLFGVPGGLVLTVLGQTSFIASFCLLLFMARLQRFDPTLEEAARDLGATPAQVFLRILVPFLRPAILSAALIAFLQSFENYNTTLFVIGTETTLTVRIASMVRLGVTPEVNALAVLFVAGTVLAAVLYELRRRREKARAEAATKRPRAAEALPRLALTDPPA